MAFKISLKIVLVLSIFLTSFSTYAIDGTKDFPNKPVRVIVGFAPGGGTDSSTRIVGQALSELWHTSVIIDNRPGAGGSVGTEITAKAAKDGYTMMLCTIASHAITPAKVKKLPYDYIKDFSFLSMIGGYPNVLMAFPTPSLRTLPEMIDYAKSNPGRLSFGSSGAGASPHLSVELLKLMTGIDITHIPYKGASPALAELIGGQIPLSVGNLPGAPLSAIKSGKVRGLAVTTVKRNSKLPDVPTIAESGVPGYEVNAWAGLCSPKLEATLETKINLDIIKVLNSPILKQRLNDQGIDVQSSSPSKFIEYVKEESLKWTKVVKAIHLEGEE